MRIVAGEWRGRRLASPGPRVRPTQDRVRQILFDILGEAIQGGPVLDLYAGSGALGLEALSRGAPSAWFVEANGAALRTLERNCAALEAGERANIVGLPVFRALPHLVREGLRFHWILADPPYGDSEVPRLLEILGSLEFEPLPIGGGLTLESRASDPVPEQTGHLRRYRQRPIGDTSLHFFRKESAGGEGGVT